MYPPEMVQMRSGLQLRCYNGNDHTHSQIKDGVLRPESLPFHARKPTQLGKGARQHVIALTDHNSIAGYYGVQKSIDQINQAYGPDTVIQFPSLEMDILHPDGNFHLIPLFGPKVTPQQVEEALLTPAKSWGESEFLKNMIGAALTLC